MKFEKLGNIIDIQKGRKPNFVENPDEASVRVLQIDDLRNDTSLKFSNDTSGVLANEDDILLVWDGANAGTIGYGKYGYIGSTLSLLRIKDKGRFSTVFVGKFLQSKFDLLKRKATGATIPHIDRKVLIELKVPLIPYSAQLHIASLLTQAETLIAQRKESIRLLDEFLKSTFLEMFGDPVRNEKGWDKSPARKILEVRGRVGWKGYKRSDLKDSGPIVLGATHLTTNGDIDLSNPVFISKEKFIESPEIVVRNRDLLIVQRGNTVGKVGLISKDIGEATINPCILILRPIKIDHFFLKYLFLNSKIQSQLWKMNTGSAQPMITQGQLNSMDVLYPPLPLQTRFARIVEQTETLKAHYQASLQELEQMYGSLSWRAFGG